MRGYISAYDAKDGRLLWRFFTVPGDPAKPYETPILREAAQDLDRRPAVEARRRRHRVGRHRLRPRHEPRLLRHRQRHAVGRRGAQRPAAATTCSCTSIVAVNADTGEYAWHYQTVPAETWDFDATSPLALADLTLDGGEAPRRDAGVEERVLLRARCQPPASCCARTRTRRSPGRRTSTCRPAGRSRSPRRASARRCKPAIVQPGAQGAHSWHPMTFSRRTGLVYTPIVETSTAFAPDPNYRYARRRREHRDGPRAGNDLRRPALRCARASRVRS